MQSLRSKLPVLRAMTINMPWKLKLYTIVGMLFIRDKSKKMKFMRDINQRREFIVPREKIPWNPSVDSDKCNSCGVCIAFCPKNVFIADKNLKAKVCHPAECVFLCNGCESKCAQKAISFPVKTEFYQYVRYK